MDLNFVKELIELVARSPIGELQVERDGLRVRIARQVSAASSTAIFSVSSMSRSSARLVASSSI